MPRSRRVTAGVLAVLLVSGGAVWAVTRGGDERPRLQQSPETTAPNGPVGGDGGQMTAPGEVVARDPAAVEVARSGGDDDTAAFAAAMEEARARSYRRPGGPGGQPQAVVYVPRGTYRLLRLEFLDDIRLEVDAGAVLQQAGGRDVPGAKSKVLIVWDGPDRDRPRRNVSIVGVGRSGGGVKDRADPVEPGWDIANSFTMNLDPEATDADGKVGGIELLHVDGFLIQNVFSIQNGTRPDPDEVQANRGIYPWPTNSKAVIVLRPRNDTPLGGPFADPRNGEIRHHYNVDSPRGYGPNQITSGHDIRLSEIYTRGGTALRLETDATKNKDFGGEVRGLRADTIMGVNCNRAVSLAPHAQRNAEVHITRVVARSCSQGVIESADEKLGAARRGAFERSSIDDVVVIAGDAAQNPAREGGGSLGAWAVGRSRQAFARDKKAEWAAEFTRVACHGRFAETSSAIRVDGALEVPACE